VITRLKNTFVWLLGTIIFFLIALLVFNALTYLNFDFTYGFLRLKQAAIATGWYLPAYYSHVLVAGVILAVGFFQVNTRYSLRWPRYHRGFGKIYAYGVIFFAAPGGLIMSFFIDRGPWVFASFVVQSVFWFVFTIMAVKEILKGNVSEHKRWMWRSYSLTFAAVTLRLYTFAFTSSFDLTQPSAYGIIAWLSWVLNLFFVEIYFAMSNRST
jgi:uncharacterized membrane protein